MFNNHTCTISRVHLITTIVLLAHHQLVQIGRDVVGSPRISIPICVNSVGVGIAVVDVAIKSTILGMEGVVEALLALHGCVPNDPAHLALRAPVLLAASTAATAAAATRLPI